MTEDSRFSCCILSKEKRNYCVYAKKKPEKPKQKKTIKIRYCTLFLKSRISLLFPQKTSWKKRINRCLNKEKVLLWSLYQVSVIWKIFPTSYCALSSWVQILLMSGREWGDWCAWKWREERSVWPRIMPFLFQAQLSVSWTSLILRSPVLSPIQPALFPVW